MQDFQQRVVDERDELAAKTSKLAAFVNSDRFQSADVDEIDRMLRQYGVMLKYQAILNERIAAF